MLEAFINFTDEAPKEEGLYAFIEDLNDQNSIMLLSVFNKDGQFYATGMLGNTTDFISLIENYKGFWSAKPVKLMYKWEPI